MHYTRKIASTEDAVKEAKQWLGDKRFAFLVSVMRGHSNMTQASRLRTLYFYCGLAGMQGRALVHGLYRHIFGANHV